MTATKTPAEAVAEAREALVLVIMKHGDFLNGERGADGTMVDSALSTFASAVRAEAFEEMRAWLDGRSPLATPDSYDDDISGAYQYAANWAKQQAEKARRK